MNKTEFFNQYKDPQWQKKRLEIMQRDNFTCQECGDKTHTLNVHHKYYFYNKKPWEYSDQALITLCEDCHSKWEEDKGIINDFTKVLLGFGWTPRLLVLLLDELLKMPPEEFSVTYIAKSIQKYHKKYNHGT